MTAYAYYNTLLPPRVWSAAAEIEATIASTALAIAQEFDQARPVALRFPPKPGDATFERPPTPVYRLGGATMCETTRGLTVYPHRDAPTTVISAYPDFSVLQVMTTLTTIRPHPLHNEDTTLDALPDEQRKPYLVRGTASVVLGGRGGTARKLQLGIASDGGVLLPTPASEVPPHQEGTGKLPTPAERAATTYPDELRPVETDERQIDHYGRIAQASLVVAHIVLEGAMLVASPIGRLDIADEKPRLLEQIRSATGLRQGGAEAHTAQYVRNFLTTPPPAIEQGE